MTEDEARTKWCPFSRVDNTHTAINREMAYNGNSPANGSLCISSDCMAWRHTKTPRLDEVGVAPEGECGLTR